MALTPTLLAISAAYVLIAVLLLLVTFTARLGWRAKAVIVVVTSLFFIEAFFATRGLLGWPGTGQLPGRFQLLWARVVEPDRKSDNKGAIYLWVEEIDQNNVPEGVPRSYRLPFSRPLADRSLAARDQIMEGNAQLGTADAVEGEDQAVTKQEADKTLPAGGLTQDGVTNVDLDPALQQAQRVEFAPMALPLLPPKNP
jgi:hypothetical protein